MPKNTITAPEDTDGTQVPEVPTEWTAEQIAAIAALELAARFAELSPTAAAAHQVAVALVPGEVGVRVYGSVNDKGRLYLGGEFPSHTDPILCQRAWILREIAGLTHHQVSNALGLHGPRLSAGAAIKGGKLVDQDLIRSQVAELVAITAAQADAAAA